MDLAALKNMNLNKQIIINEFDKKETITDNLTNINDTLPNININLVNEFIKMYKETIVSTTEEQPKIYTLLEFFLNFYKKMEKLSEETCGNISAFNLSKMQKCIIDYENRFYPRNEKVNLDLILLNEQYTNAEKKQTQELKLGYYGSKIMYNDYKEIHPFFESQLKKSLSIFNAILEKSEQGKKQKIENERIKEEEEIKKIENPLIKKYGAKNSVNMTMVLRCNCQLPVRLISFSLK